MSRDHNRVNAVIEKLRENYRPMEEGESETKDDLLLSVVIPARNEFPNIMHTIYSLWHAWEADGFDRDEMEIIIVNNCSTDWQNEKYEHRKPGDRGTTEHLLPRGAFWARKVRVIYDPIAGNHSARNKGAEEARGKYLFFSDAHMAYKPGFFKLMIETIKKTKGMFHGSIAWMGAYPPTYKDGNNHGVGCSYTLKLGEEIKGCVDEKTEILTKNGWKKWNEVSYETEFASVKMTGKDAKTIEYQKPRDLVIKDFEGEMIEIKHRNYDAVLTKNHRCFYQSKELREHSRNGNRSEYEWRVKFAENLQKTNYLPVATKGIPKSVSVLNDDMVELLGWIITEGCYNSDETIVITQFKEHNRIKILNNLDNLEIKYCIKGEKKDIKIAQNDSRFIKKFIPVKELTEELLNLCSHSQLKKLYNVLIDGDGTRSKSSDRFYQANEKTIDVFQILCILLGYQSKKYLRKKEYFKGNHYGGDVYYISVKKNPFATDFKIDKIKYNGKVWCPDLKNGSIFIRRNGQTMLTGNTWNSYSISKDHYFYIPALGHCSVGVERKQFLEFGGYPKIHRSYGGGEFYLNLKWWMFGSNISVHPQAIGYHLSAGRGYSWNHDDYVHNVLNIGIALGMDDWTERAYFNWLRRGNKKVLKRMYEEAKRETKEDREFIKNKRKFTFNEILKTRPWEVKNKKMLGGGLPNISIFHTSWTDLLKDSPEVKKMYNNSKLQRDLDKFIKKDLWDWVYKKDNYDRKAKFEI